MPQSDDTAIFWCPLKLSGLYLVGCLTALIGCTGGEGRIHLPEQERITLQNAPGIRAVHWYRTDGFWIFGEPYGMLSGQRITAEDPITTVKTQFLSSLTARLDSTNIQSVDSPSWWGRRHNLIRPCCAQDGIQELSDKFAAGLIMDFASDIPRLWDADPTDFSHHFHWDWSKLGQKPTYNLYYTARARLIRLDDHQILWQGRCVVGAQDSRASLHGRPLIGVNAAGMVLVRIGEDTWPDAKAQEDLSDQLLPGPVAELLHCWRVGARWPMVRVLA